MEHGDIEFNQYFEPTCHISKGASQITGLTTNGLDLCLYGDVIKDTVPAEDGIKMFLSWLKKNFPESCTLVSHNGKRFDFPILKRYLGMASTNCGNLYGLDSREVFKRRFPDLARNRMEALVEEFSPTMKNKSHDALGDAQNLSVIINEASRRKNLNLREFLMIEDRDMYKIS